VSDLDLHTANPRMVSLDALKPDASISYAQVTGSCTQ
jgi:hypothetical protein